MLQICSSIWSQGEAGHLDGGTSDPEPGMRPEPLFSLKMRQTSCRRGPGDREVGSVAGLKGKRDLSAFLPVWPHFETLES